MLKPKNCLRVVVYLFVISVAIYGHGENPCRVHLANSMDAMEIMASFEQKIQSLRELYSNNLQTDPKIDAELTHISSTFESFLAGLDTESDRLENLNKILSAFGARLNRLEATLNLQIKRQLNTELEPAIENPLLLKPNFLYEIKGSDPTVKRVSFSKDVLENIFWSNQPLMIRAAQLIFKGLKRGRQFATEKSGVAPFTNDHQIFKVRIIGPAVGAIRVAGFFQGTDFHIVAWSDDPEHNTQQSTRLTERVHHIRNKFLSLGRY